jgi:peptidyl-prolyl cis-trans isomerase D
MFDLFRSRDKAVRILLGALLVVVGFSMLTYLIPSYNTGSSANDVVIAEIGKDTITLPEVQRLVQNTLRGRQMPPEIMPSYVPQMIDNLINERALAYEAERLGFEITDSQISEAIKSYVPALFQDGKFVGKEAYASLLSQQNLTIPEFENEMRRQLLITRLRDVALEGTIVTPQEIEAEYRKKNEKIKVEYVKLTADKYKSEIEPSMDDMQRTYEINKAQYMSPETRNLAILIADQAKIEQSINPTDAEIQRAYTQNIAQFRAPETVKVRHILLMTQGKPPADDAKIKAQAEDIAKQVRGGADFTALVTKYSEDPGKATNNGEYSVTHESEMLPEFKTAAFSQKVGETEVVKTAVGYHIIQVMSHEPARVKPFEEVKAQLAADWKKQRVNDMMQQISDKAQAMLAKDPMHPEKVAAAFNMQLVRADGVKSGAPIPEIGVSPDFDQSIAGLKKGEVSQPVALANNKIALAVVEDVLPPRPSTFAEMQGQIRQTIITNRGVSVVQNHAKELVEKAKSMGGDLAKAAKSMGLEVKTSDDIARSGAVEGLGSAAYVQEGFKLPAGSIFGPVPTPDATIVAKVVSHVEPNMAGLAEQRVQIRDQIKSQKGHDRGLLFEAGLREALVKQGKIKIHQDVINRLMASYKGA